MSSLKREKFKEITTFLEMVGWVGEALVIKAKLGPVDLKLRLILGIIKDPKTPPQ